MGGLIIPGVQVSVVKEVLPQQLAPSGILGIVGFTEKVPDAGVERAGNWNRLKEVFGAGTALSIPEARQALDNGVSQLVIAPLPDSAGARAAIAVPGPDPQKGAAVTLTARAGGVWANGVKVRVAKRDTADGKGVVDLKILRPDGTELESHRGVTIDAGTDRDLARVLERSAVVSASAVTAWPKDGEYTLAGGADATPEQYAAALALLAGEPDVDMVLAAVQDFSEARKTDVIKIYSDVIAHCENLSRESKGRVGFGQVPRIGTAAQHVEIASYLVSDRFVLAAPHGVVGAVAGMVGSLSYFHSPTFKTLAGLGVVPTIAVDAQKELLTGRVVPVVNERGKGVIVLRGITTDGDQINVRRVADRACRTMKMIGDLFIGRLNNADGRSALKQKLIEALLQMEKDGAIVPSTDGKDPSFKVDVYSSQADFALGIVRVDMAVRPVRAIDYIYATILVQV
jgi:hypothetical protein